jgi:hypothetical protein
MSIFRKDARGRYQWLTDRDGLHIRRELRPAMYLPEVFASEPSHRFELKRCIELGERKSIEVQEQDWDDFLRELRASQRIRPEA